MKIGELATAAACDIETIRYYEKTGLLAAPARADNGYRTYTSTHLADLRFIRQCRSLQIGLADVRTLIALRVDRQASCGSVNDLVDHHIARIDVQLQSLELLRTELVQLRRQCDGPHPMEDCAILRELSSKDAEEHGLSMEGT